MAMSCCCPATRPPCTIKSSMPPPRIPFPADLSAAVLHGLDRDCCGVRRVIGAGSALGSAFLGLGALRLLRALYLDQLPTMKHHGVFLGRGVCEIYLLLPAHCFHFSDGSFREI